MKTMLFAAMAALSLASTAAFAESEGGPAANTKFTTMRGVLAEAPMQMAPMAMAQNGQTVQAYAAQSSRGIWLSQPQDGGGANN